MTTLGGGRVTVSTLAMRQQVLRRQSGGFPEAPCGLGTEPVAFPPGSLLIPASADGTPALQRQR